MTWLKENKFVAGVLVVTLAAGSGLGWMLLQAKTKYNQSAAAFETQANELKRLETAPAYPDKENLQAAEQQRLEHLTMITDLQKSLVAAGFPTEPIAPNQFQDQLKAAVTQFTAKAGKVTIPKGFYYGFEQYATTLPNVEVAPVLARELKAIQLLFDTLLAKGKGRVVAITSFSRESFAEEINKKPGEVPKATPKPAPRRPGEKPAAAPVEPLVKPHFVDLVFVAEQGAVVDYLNELAANKQQFFITRYVALHNTNDKPPSRDAGTAASVSGVDPVPAPVPETPLPGAPQAPSKDPIVLGNEKVEVTLRVEIVDFAQPKAEVTPKAKPNAGK